MNSKTTMLPDVYSDSTVSSDVRTTNQMLANMYFPVMMHVTY